MSVVGASVLDSVANAIEGEREAKGASLGKSDGAAAKGARLGKSDSAAGCVTVGAWLGTSLGFIEAATGSSDFTGSCKLEGIRLGKSLTAVVEGAKLGRLARKA